MIPAAMYEAYMSGDTERMESIARAMSGGIVSTRKHCERCDVFWSDDTTICFACDQDIDKEPEPEW